MSWFPSNAMKRSYFTVIGNFQKLKYLGFKITRLVCSSIHFAIISYILVLKYWGQYLCLWAIQYFSIHEKNAFLQILSWTYFKAIIWKYVRRIDWRPNQKQHLLHISKIINGIKSDFENIVAFPYYMVMNPKRPMSYSHRKSVDYFPLVISTVLESYSVWGPKKKKHS